MFGGGSAFGSSAFGQQPQQQQQQQQNPLFGQQPQQQQPQQSAFGGFGQTSAAPSAFGAANTGMPGFGAGTSSTPTAFGTQATTPAFGSATNTTSGFNARPSAFGSSAFGSTATQQPTSSGFGFGSTSTAAPAFGAAANTATSGGLFGSRPAATSAFGSTAPTTGGVFGSTPATNTGFGASSSTPFGATATGQVQGTVNPEYTATVERDASTGVNNHFQTITAMPAYRNYSVEELRVQDYQAGRKNAGNAAATGGAFGSTGGFGAQTSTPFGQSSTTSAFGAQPSTSTAGSAFGQTTGGFGQSTGAFGQNTSTGGFGASNTGTTGGLFGQQPASTTPAFGSTPAATTGFGSSAFGQPQQQQTTGFGSTPAAGGFGASAAAKPFSFGQTPATSQPATGFGATGTTGFGQQPQQQQQSVGGLFGQAAQATPSFGQQQSTGTSFGFGAKPATTQPATGFGGFGASTANKPTGGFSFGASTTTTPSATATSGFGGFGGATGTAGTTGFGATGGATGGLFGASKPAAATGLFGNTQQGATTGFGGFGAPNATGTAGAGGLFGAKPAATGMSAPLSFGATGQTGGFFGGQQNINTSGSFNLPATGGLTTFGTTGLQQQPNANQPPLYASLDKYPYGYNPLFENLPASGGTAERSSSVAVSEEPSKKLSTTPHFLLTPRAATRIKLRGYSFTPSGEVVTRKTSGLDGISDEAVLRPEAFAPRPSIKRLIVNKKVSPNDVSNAVNGDNGVLSSGQKSKALFDPHLEMIATQHGVPGTAQDADRPSQAAESTKNVNRNTAFSDEAMSQGYYIKPSLQILGNMSIQDLKKVQNLVVGLKGVGEITFDGPVDLSEIDLDQIMVGIVNFQLKTCTVYPDEMSKPPRGKGLNVPATIKLEKCYPSDKTTKQPITDPQHPRVIAIIRKLREVPETEFINFEASTGTWTFKVQHF